MPRHGVPLPVLSASPRANSTASRADSGSRTPRFAGAGTHHDTGTLWDTLTENSPGVPGVAEVDDRYGEVLAADADGVLIGQPREASATGRTRMR